MNMDNWQPAADRNGNRETKNLSETTQLPSTNSEGALSMHGETKSNEINMSLSSAFDVLLQNATLSSNNLENEGRDFTLAEILVSEVKKNTLLIKH